MGRTHEAWGRGGRGGLPCLAFVLAVMAALPAWGQGFMVKPMKIEAAPRPGTTVEIPLELRNTAAQGPRSLNLRLVELSQTETGSWRPIEPDEDEDISHLASCRDWITLGASQVQIAPLEPAQVMVSIRAPANARGTYFAAVIAETPLPEQIQGMVVRVRFLIPVIVEIQGRPVRQQIRLDDLSLTYRPAQATQPATTLAAMHITNEGLTYSRVRGDLNVELLHNERWRPVARLDIPQKGIIPGVTLTLGDDLKRRLPSGTYRLRGNLYVDGRRVSPLDKEIAFEGDPDVTTLAYDTPLILEPQEVVFNASPGATRTSVVQVENPSEDALVVRAEALLPASLQGVALGDLRGDALSAAPWVQVRPEQFNLRPGGKQNLRILTRVPREGVEHANYYADLVLHAAYADGQSAGTTRSMLTVTNSAVASEAKAAADRLSVAAQEEAVYVVHGQFSNVGNVHIQPTAEAEVIGDGGRVVVQTALSGETSVMLPLGVRQFAGTMDFAAVEPGAYLLRARLMHAGNPLVVTQVPISVEEEAGQKAVVIAADRAADQDTEAGETP